MWGEINGRWCTFVCMLWKYHDETLFYVQFNIAKKSNGRWDWVVRQWEDHEGVIYACKEFVLYFYLLEVHLDVLCNIHLENN
jgi:hypothetical protein